MANYKRKCREALVACLADGTTGFNAQLAALGQSYGITPFALEFAKPSKNVVYGYMDDEEIQISQIFEFPGAVIYSTESVNERKIKPKTFSGFVNQFVVMYLRYRKYEDDDLMVNQPDFDGDFEKFPDAVEDAMNSALEHGRSIMANLGVNFENYRADRGPIQSLGDGHVQILTFTLGMVVHV
jgi:hypothetical protein